MPRLGRLLQYLGVVLGGLLGLGMLAPVHYSGMAWLLEIGIAKLTFLSAIGLIAGGTVVERMALRAAERPRLPPGDPN